MSGLVWLSMRTTVAPHIPRYLTVSGPAAIQEKLATLRPDSGERDFGRLEAGSTYITPALSSVASDSGERCSSPVYISALCSPTRGGRRRMLSGVSLSLANGP